MSLSPGGFRRQSQGTRHESLQACVKSDALVEVPAADNWEEPQCHLVPARAALASLRGCIRVWPCDRQELVPPAARGCVGSPARAPCSPQDVPRAFELEVTSEWRGSEDHRGTGEWGHLGLPIRGQANHRGEATEGWSVTGPASSGVHQTQT